MTNIIKRANVLLLIIWISTKWMFQINLGNYVWYKGKKYMVLNGVRLESWRLGDLDNGDSGWVPRSECKLSLAPSNILHSFRSGYRFYMGYWYDIWVNEG